MQNATIVLIATVFGFVTTSVSAATEQVSVTGYTVVIHPGEQDKLANGTGIVVGARDHSSVVNDKTGEQASEWCEYDSQVDGSGATTQFAGHCIEVYDSGDVAYIGIVGTTDDQPGTWTVLGGTGKYAGATGGGTSKTTSTRADGYASTYRSTGTITTK